MKKAPHSLSSSSARGRRRRYGVIRLTTSRVGKSFVVILPGTLIKAMKLVEGDTLFLVEGPDGFRMTPHAPDFERQMKVAEEVMRRNRRALRQLSKR